MILLLKECVWLEIGMIEMSRLNFNFFYQFERRRASNWSLTFRWRSFENFFTKTFFEIFVGVTFVSCQEANMSWENVN